MKPPFVLSALLAAFALPVLAAPLLPAEENAAKVYESVLPALVQVDAEWTEATPEVSAEFLKFFGQQAGEPRKRRTVGTGVVWDAAGHVVTTAPAARTGSTLTLGFADGSRRSARLLGTDARIGISVLQIDGGTAGLHPATIGTSRPLRIGQQLYCIGNAYGKANVLSSGMLGAITKAMSDDGHANLVLNSSVNPGNAGGPVLDTAGQVVGLIEGDYASGGHAGYALALPVDDLTAAIARLIAGEHGQPARLGLDVAQRNPEDLPAGLPKGVPVLGLDAGGPAQRAGVQPRAGDAIDVITAFDGVPIETYADLRAQLEQHRPGDSCTLAVWRAGRTRTLKVTLDAARGDAAPALSPRSSAPRP